MKNINDQLDIITDLIARAKAAGADDADAVFLRGMSVSLAYRMGRLEHLERSEGADLGLRVFIGRRQAMVSSSDLSRRAIGELLDRAMAMAREVPEDPWCGLAGPEALATDFPDLDIFDSSEPGDAELADMAACAEEVAMSVKGITNSEGAEAGWSRGSISLASSNGFARSYCTSSNSLAVSVLAGEGTAMERDYDYGRSVHAEDLRRPEDIGRKAGELAVRRLNPRKVKTTQVPVVFDPRVSNSLIGHLSSAINGTAVARATTFLKDKMGEAIFAKSINIIDDPNRLRGLKSRPFDGEGLASQKRKIIDDGVLVSWITDLGSSRQLGTESTGHARRGTSSPPSPGASNFYMEPGSISPTKLMADIKSGFYVTELIGFGINQLTGDYSRGAGGFWIEDGEIAYPVSEVTVAGNLNHIFANMTAADDLEFRFGTDAPTLRVEGMTVAGR